MPPNFAFKVSAPKLRTDAIRLELLSALGKSGKKLKEEFEKTTKTWKGEKPTFEPIISVVQGTGAGLDMALTGAEKGVRKWFYLNEGTSVRYAILSDDWESKTTPGFVGSGPGRGRVVAVNVNSPQPGIETRGWTDIIKREFKPVFREDMQAALATGMKKAQEG